LHKWARGPSFFDSYSLLQSLGREAGTRQGGGGKLSVDRWKRERWSGLPQCGGGGLADTRGWLFLWGVLFHLGGSCVFWNFINLLGKINSSFSARPLRASPRVLVLWFGGGDAKRGTARNPMRDNPGKRHPCPREGKTLTKGRPRIPRRVFKREGGAEVRCCRFAGAEAGKSEVDQGRRSRTIVQGTLADRAVTQRIRGGTGSKASVKRGRETGLGEKRRNLRRGTGPAVF